MSSKTNVTNLIQTLWAFDLILGKSPHTVLVLDQQIQSPVEQSIQVGLVSTLVCFGDSGQWSLHSDFLASILSGAVLTVCSLGISDQSIHLRFRLARLVVNEDLIVPTRLSVCIVDTNVAGGGLPQLDLSLPLAVAWCSLLVVKVTGKGKCQTFVQSFLVEEESLFERVKGARQDGRS